MKVSIYVFTAITACCLFSCGNKTSVEKSKITSKQNINKEILSPILCKELNDFIYYNDSLKMVEKSKANIFFVSFYKENEDCYVSIIENNHYNNSTLEGYILISNNLITFNYIDECDFGLVDKSQLKKDSIPKIFPDENSDAALKIYDSIGKKYRIHNKDSLELIFFGFL